jgi:hypothetical protein
MSFDRFINESFANAKLHTFWNAQANDSFDFFAKANEGEHSDLSFIYQMDDFSIIHHYEDTPALLLSDTQEEKVELKQTISCKNKLKRIEEEIPENRISKSDSINPFCHDSLEEKEDSNGIQKSTQFQATSKRSSSLSDASKDAPARNSQEHFKESAKRSAGRKPENLGLMQRKDVVLKTILRKIRTWFWKDFTSVADFKSVKDNKNEVIYSEWLKKYSSEKFSSNQSETFMFYLSSLMSSKNTEQQVSLEHGLFYEAEEKKRSRKLNRVREVHGLLYKFSYTKLKNLLQNKDL